MITLVILITTIMIIAMTIITIILIRTSMIMVITIIMMIVRFAPMIRIILILPIITIPLRIARNGKINSSRILQGRGEEEAIQDSSCSVKAGR